MASRSTTRCGRARCRRALTSTTFRQALRPARRASAGSSAFDGTRRPDNLLGAHEPRRRSPRQGVRRAAEDRPASAAHAATQLAERARARRPAAGMAGCAHCRASLAAHRLLLVVAAAARCCWRSRVLPCAGRSPWPWRVVAAAWIARRWRRGARAAGALDPETRDAASVSTAAGEPRLPHRRARPGARAPAPAARRTAPRRARFKEALRDAYTRGRAERAIPVPARQAARPAGHRRGDRWPRLDPARTDPGARAGLGLDPGAHPRRSSREDVRRGRWSIRRSTCRCTSR